MAILSHSRGIAVAFLIGGFLCAPILSYHLISRARADGGGPEAGIRSRDAGTTSVAKTTPDAPSPATTAPQTGAKAIPAWLWVAIPVALAAIGITAWQIGKSPNKPV